MVSFFIDFVLTHSNKMIMPGKKHQHNSDMIRSLLISTSLPEYFWVKMALTAIYIINHTPPTIHNTTPYEPLYEWPPSFSHLRVFGCACFVTLPPHEHTKLKPWSHLCYFLGYSIEHKEYCCFDPIDHCLFMSHVVVFWEHIFIAIICSLKPISPSYSIIFTGPNLSLLSLLLIMVQVNLVLIVPP